MCIRDRPPWGWEAFCAAVQLQRCDLGTPARAISTWLPQPAQVGLLQVRQVVRWHIGILLGEERLSPIYPRGYLCANPGHSAGNLALTCRHVHLRPRTTPATDRMRASATGL